MIASSRNPKGAGQLQQLASEYPKDRLALLELDVSSQESVDAAAKAAVDLLPNGLDHLISNAGQLRNASAGLETM